MSEYIMDIEIHKFICIYKYTYTLGEESPNRQRLSLIPAISRALSPMNLLRLTSRDHKELINAKINLEKNMNDMHTDKNNLDRYIYMITFIFLFFFIFSSFFFSFLPSFFSRGIVNSHGFKNVSGANDYKSVSGRKAGNRKGSSPSIFPLTWYVY
jgi:hypothetical protein